MGKRVHGHLLPIPEVLLKVKKLGLQAWAVVAWAWGAEVPRD